MDVTPSMAGAASVRKASSSCCGAPLTLLAPGQHSITDPRDPQFGCTSCGRPCDRVLSDPEEVTRG